MGQKNLFWPRKPVVKWRFFYPYENPKYPLKTTIYRGSKPHCITSRVPTLLHPILGNCWSATELLGFAIFLPNDEHRVATRGWFAPTSLTLVIHSCLLPSIGSNSPLKTREVQSWHDWSTKPPTTTDLGFINPCFPLIRPALCKALFLRGVFFAGRGGSWLAITKMERNVPIPKISQPSHEELGLFSLGPKFGDQILTMGGGHRRRGGRHGNMSIFLAEIQKMIPMTEVLGGQQKNCFERFFRAIEQWKNPGWLGYIGDGILPSYIGIIINQYKDPY